MYGLLLPVLVLSVLVAAGITIRERGASLRKFFCTHHAHHIFVQRTGWIDFGTNPKPMIHTLHS